MMNIQIFGKSKCFDTKKAERYFKERRIKYQLIDVLSKGLSKGELESVTRKIKVRDLVDEKSKAYTAQSIQKLSLDKSIMDKLMDHPILYRTPIVRNGKDATLGYCPEVWEKWE